MSRVSFISMNAILMMLLSNLVIASDHEEIVISERMQEVVRTHSADIFQWATSPLVIESIKAQNQNPIPSEKYIKIDQEWMAGKQKEFVSHLQGSKLSQFLQEKVESSSLYVEAFACDNQGLIVGLFPRTTDYWQGDEDKFSKSFASGQGRVIFSPIAFDESTKTYSVHISIPVRDWNKTIGVLIVGLKNIQ